MHDAIFKMDTAIFVAKVVTRFANNSTDVNATKKKNSLWYKRNFKKYGIKILLNHNFLKRKIVIKAENLCTNDKV